MKKFVVMSGGFHPFHAGHASLYEQAKKVFPDAKVLVCATNVQTERPFPFKIKKALAELSGVPPKDFIEVSRQFSPEDPALKQQIGDLNAAIVIFVRSDKDEDEPPQGLKLNPAVDEIPMVTRGPNKGKPQKILDYEINKNNLLPASQHTYMAYLKTVEFGDGLTSASEIRAEWPKLDNDGKLNRVMSFYPRTQQNKKLADVAVKMLDAGIIGDQVNEEGIAEGWKDVVAGGALALASLGANAQTSDMDNIQQYTQLTKQYYEALIDRAEEDGFVLDRRDLNRIKAKAQDMAAAKVAKQKQSNTQNNNSSSNSFPSQGSERRVASDRDQFESMDVEEAILINDPEQGHLIQPDGGMGTWDEKSLLSNLIRKFSSIAEMIKEKRYSNLYHSLYEAGVVENMLKALVQYENFKEKQGNRPIAKGKKIELKEIDFSSGLDDRNFSVKKILEIGKVVGQIEGYDVVKATAGSQEVYFLVSDDNVHSLIGFDNGYLKNIKNVSKQSGVVRALLGYLVHIQKQPIEISHTEPLTSDGLRWVIHLIEKPRGLVITNQDNEPINVEELKNEWDQAKETGNPGTTSITITEDTKFGNKIRTNESYRHSDSLLMPFIFYTKNQDYLTEK